MEELSIEEKAARYDEAIETARKIKNGEPIDVPDGTLIPVAIFPELKESEDEKIKQQVVYAIKQLHVCECTKDKLLAWLERQGEANKEYWRGYREGKKEILDKLRTEKRDKNEVDSLFTFDDILALQCAMTNAKVTDKELYNALQSLHDKVHDAYHNEKQGEQNPADKVEPKFHKGQWITNGDYTWQIVDVTEFDYILQSQEGNKVDDTISHVDEQFHVFSIQDAKDGDVLAYPDGSITLFKYMNENIYMAYVLWVDGHIELNNSCAISNVHPATKEQRDLLFQRMKEAGYEWNAEKKELKKIEQKQSFDIEIPFGAKDSELQEVTYYIPKGFHAEIDDDKVVIKKGEKPTAWSEEDEHRIKDTIYFLDTAKKHYASTVELDACINWLKSLKQRIGGEL